MYETRGFAYNDIGNGPVKQAMTHHPWLPSIHVVVLSILRNPPPPTQNKTSVNWCNGISVYSVELLSMFKCLKDFFACQDERFSPVYYQTPLSPFLSGLGCMKDRLHTVVLL